MVKWPSTIKHSEFWILSLSGKSKCSKNLHTYIHTYIHTRAHAHTHARANVSWGAVTEKQLLVYRKQKRVTERLLQLKWSKVRAVPRSSRIISGNLFLAHNRQNNTSLFARSFAVHYRTFAVYPDLQMYTGNFTVEIKVSFWRSLPTSQTVMSF